MPEPLAARPSPAPLLCPLVCIVGPSGSGKTSLALALAREFKGEIVNCDSLQLYRGLDIGTAKLPVSARQGIPHHLFDVLDLAQSYSAGDYSRDARKIVAEIYQRGYLPVVAGGTGFYLKALLEGLPPLPDRNQALRARLLALEIATPGKLHRILQRLDARSAARIHPRDIQKLIRAVEVRLVTGRSRTQAPDASSFKQFSAPNPIIKIGLNPPREQLHQQLEERTHAMFAEGLVEEVRALLSAGATGQEKPFESLGYKQTLQHLRGEITLQQAISSTLIATRQYTKRQWTWFRRDSEVLWLEGFGDEEVVVRQAAEVLRTRLPQPAG